MAKYVTVDSRTFISGIVHPAGTVVTLDDDHVPAISLAPLDEAAYVAMTKRKEQATKSDPLSPWATKVVQRPPAPTPGKQTPQMPPEPTSVPARTVDTGKPRSMFDIQQEQQNKPKKQP